MNEACRKLIQLGQPLPVSAFLVALHQGLPESRMELRGQLMSIMANQDTTDDEKLRQASAHIQAVITLEEATQKMEEVNISANLVQGRGRFQRRGGRSTTPKAKGKITNKAGVPVECFGCKGNHFAMNCPDARIRQAQALILEAQSNPSNDSNGPTAPAANLTSFDFAPSTPSAGESWFGMPSISTASVNITVTDMTYFWADSGATHHVTPHHSYFHRYTAFTTPLPVRVGDNRHIPALGHGDIQLVSSLPGAQRKFVLRKVLYVPGISRCLMSTSQLQGDGIRVVLNDGTPACRLEQAGTLIALGDVVEGLYRIRALPEVDFKPQALLLRADTRPSAHVLHKRFAHASLATLQKMQKCGAVANLDVPDTAETNLPCTGCAQGGLTCKPFISGSMPRARGVLDIVHSDLAESSQATHCGKRYAVSYIDDYSGYSAMYFLTAKSQQPAAYAQFKAWAETQTGKKIKVLHCDRGGEYYSKAFKAQLRADGTQLDYTVAYSPQTNGCAE